MKLKKKLIATILTVMMLISYISTLKSAVIAATTNLVEQNSKTNNTNVEFNSYFEGKEYSKTFEIGKEAKLYLSIKVSNTGYLKNGVVQFSNANFEVDSNNLKNDKVQSSSKNEIKFKQINNSSNENIIEVPITMTAGETVDSNLFNKITTVIFTGTYIDENGKEKTIKKELNNEVKWKGTAEVELLGEVSKFLPYEIGEEKGVLVQARIKSGIKDNSLPIASTKLEVSLPELKVSEETNIKPERITVVANTTAGTNGKGSNEFGKSDEANYTYNDETGNIEINVVNKAEDGQISWKKASDEYIISYFYTGEEVYNSVKAQLELASKTIKTDEEKEAGQVNENALTGAVNVKATIEVYNSEETKIEKSGKINYSVEKAIGTMIDNSISSVSEISKGYIYANYTKAQKEANKETVEAKKDTDYEVSYTAKIYDANIVEAVEFETEAEKYVDNEGKEYSSKVENKEGIYSKKVKIDEAIFNKMLGEEGKIEITNKSGEKLGEITKKSEKDNEGNYIVNIAESKENVIIIKTSKPIIEGYITVVVEKAISSSQSYTKEKMESFEKITLGVTTKIYAGITEEQEETTEIEKTTAETTQEIATNSEEQKETTKKLVEATKISKSTQTKLKEPVSKAEISINAENLSTIVENKDVELRVVLDTSSVENALYKNPMLKIILPENIEAVKLNSADILLDDELKIKEKKITEQNGRKAILITLEGTQSQYMDNGTTKNTEGQNVIAKGANIVIKTDITFKKLAPSAKTNVLLYYTNENSNLYKEVATQGNTKATRAYNLTTTSTTETMGIATTGVEIVSPNGVVTENNMSGYNGTSSISNYITEKQEEIITTNSTAKEVTIGGTIVNNYANSIENVFVLGRTPFSGNKQIDGTEELGSNFTMKMISRLSISGIDSSKVKVYYSTNGEATKDLANTENGWTEEPTNLTEVKSYLIAITGEVATGAQFSFNYKVELPANLDYNNSSYTIYKVYYDNKMEDATLGETKVAGIIGLTTGAAPDISVEIQSTIDTVREGQIVKMKAIVKNSGSLTAKNVKVTITAPENATIMNYIEYNWFETIGNSQDIDIGNIEPNDTAEISYYIKFNDDFVTDGEKEVSHKINATADGIAQTVYSNEYKFNVKEGKITLEFIPKVDAYMKKGDVYDCNIYIDKIVDESLKNAAITIQLPKEIKYNYAQICDMGVDNRNWNSEGITYDETTHSITVNIETLNNRKLLQINGEVTSDIESTSIYAKATADGVEETYSNITEHYIEDVKLEVSELTSTPKYVKEDEMVTYNLTITNKNNSSITGVNILDELPEGITFERATYTNKNGENSITTLQDGIVKISIGGIEVGETINIQIIARANVLPDTNDKEIKNKMTVTVKGSEIATTNTVTNIIEYNQTLHDKINEQEGSENQETQHGGYKITGTAWIDSNKDGKRDETENLLSDMQVILIYKSNSQIVTDADTGEYKITKTDSNGKYEFLNLLPEEYLVIFIYDSGTYNITDYKKSGVDESYNSDAINMKIILDGEQRYAGVTDNIKITQNNVRDIDIGLYVSEKFDLRLDKYISKITKTTPTSGTKIYNYDNSKLIKQELYGKDVNNSTLVIEYKIVVTNEGKVPGYAKKIIDYLPDDVKFSSELNKDWYTSNSDTTTIYNTSLQNELINPGESKEVTLILSLNITDKNIGTIVNNNAEIYESYNEQGLEDIDSIPANRLESEDDMSNADIITSIATGKIVLYITLTLVVIALLTFGVYEIRKYVINKKNN